MQDGQQPSPGSLNHLIGIKQSKRGCNCKNSKCLKLYCECFSMGEYCSNCNCANCHNNASSEVIIKQNYRKEAIQGILERNPQAFRPKIAVMSPLNLSKDLSKHSKGCACKRTGCLKKYCECYQAGITCSENCKCIECEPIIENLELVKEFIDGVVQTVGFQILIKKEVDECNLMCEEETLASEGNSNSSMDSPGKKIYTYSSEYKRIESLIYEKLINALHRII